MANRKPDIKFPISVEVQKGRPEEGAKKDRTFVPLVNALTHPKEDARHQAVTVQATLKIYEKHGGKLIATVAPRTGFSYLKAENGEEFLFLEKRQVQKIVKELKMKSNLTWPLWLVFAASKDDLPDNLSKLEKPEAVATPNLYERYEEALKEFTKIGGELLEFKALFGEEEFALVLETLRRNGGSYIQDAEQLLGSILEKRFTNPEMSLASPLKNYSEKQGVEKAATITATIDGLEVRLTRHWKEENKVTHAQAAAILNLKQTRSIRQKVKEGDLRSAGTGDISVPSLLEYLDQKPSPQN